MSKNIFKTGDRVRALKSDGTGGIILGEVYVVSDISCRYESRISFIDSRGASNGWCEKYFQLVDEQTVRTFKIGDKVKCIDDAGTNCKVGQIYTVYAFSVSYVSVEDDLSYVSVEDDHGARYGGLNIRRFELVNESSPEELFELFKKGAEAKNKLIELGVLFYGKTVKASDIDINKYSLKKKKEFQTFHLRDSAHVVTMNINDNTLIQVGCQEIKFELLLDNLKCLFEKNESSTDLFNCTVFGVFYKPTRNNISVEDARELYNKMKDYDNERI